MIIEELCERTHLIVNDIYEENESSFINLMRFI